MKQQDMTCIGCPVGCTITVSLNEETGAMDVTGNLCAIGDRYGKQEMIDPKRMATSTVLVKGGKQAVVSVKTQDSIPKELVKDSVRLLAEIEVSAPVRIGDVIVKNILDTGIDIVATDNVELNEY